MPSLKNFKKPAKFTFTVDGRLVCIVLLVIIIVMLGLWRPWQRTNSGRTVYVVGEAKLEAEPDEFVFYPTYEFENVDQAATLTDLGKKSGEIVAKLKDLGVPENKIKTDTNGNSFKGFYPGENDNNPTYMLTMTITVQSRETAQKVSDYLLSTAPLGSVSPQPGFSDAKRKELQTKARDEAVKDARNKAEQNARNTGTRLDKVKEVSDGEGFNNDMPIPYGGVASSREALAVDSASSYLSVLPGETELRYTVHVTYFVR